MGRVLAGVFGSWVGLRRLIGWAIGLAAVSMAVVWADLGSAPTVAGIALTGFLIAPIFPGLMSDTRNRVEARHLANTIGMQIAGAGLGGAAHLRVRP